ncbi:hypothetical protein Tco_0057580 [Tanacetum coccineum]
MSPPIRRKYHDSVAFATGCKKIKKCRRGNRKIRIPIAMWPCRVEEKMTLKEVDGQAVEEIETKIIAKDGTITRVPGKFQGYETSEEEPVEQPRRHDLYGFVDHPQLQQGNLMNEFAPHRLPQPKGNMNGWLIENEEEVERDEVDSDLESTASSKPVAHGSSKNYKIFSEMLDDFDRQDVVDLYSLVKEMYEIISSEGYDRLLWGDLITLFKSSEEDEVWKGEQDYKLISWRLFDSCGVYVLLMDTRVSIHMMVDMKYPLTQEMLSRMLNRRLEVDHESTIAFELIRFIKAQLKTVWDDSIIESVEDRFYGSNVENYIDAIERNITMNFSICRKYKRSREWVVVNMVKIEALKKRNVDNKKLIFNGVNQYTNEYQAQQKKIIQLRCEAGLKCSLIRMTISGSETATNSRTCKSH